MASVRDAEKWKKLLVDEKFVVEEGFYTANQIQEMIGMKSTATKERISQKIKENKCIRKDFVTQVNGFNRLVPHYKIIE